MIKKGPDSYPNDDQTHLAEPEHLKADDPGECPRPHGCRCRWYPLSLGWARSYLKGCKIHDS